MYASITIQQAVEECLFVRLSNIIVLHSIALCVFPQNDNYRAMIIKLSI